MIHQVIKAKLIVTNAATAVSIWVNVQIKRVSFVSVVVTTMLTSTLQNLSLLSMT